MKRIEKPRTKAGLWFAREDSGERVKRINSLTCSRSSHPNWRWDHGYGDFSSYILLLHSLAGVLSHHQTGIRRRPWRDQCRRRASFSWINSRIFRNTHFFMIEAVRDGHRLAQDHWSQPWQVVWIIYMNYNKSRIFCFSLSHHLLPYQLLLFYNHCDMIEQSFKSFYGIPPIFLPISCMYFWIH